MSAFTDTPIQVAAARVDRVLAQQGVSRSERRELIAALKNFHQQERERESADARALFGPLIDAMKGSSK